MKLRKRLSALLVGAAMLLTMVPALTPSTAAAAGTGTIVLTIDSPTMTVNGTSKAIDAEGSKPTLDSGGYTMLPLRGIVEAMGGSLTWDAANRTVTMVKDSQTIQVPIGSTKITVNGTQKDMLANNGTYKAAYINSAGRTLVHVRALEAFNNTKCTWNQATKQVTVTYPDNSTPVVTSKNYRVDVINKSGQDITTLCYGLSGTYSYGQNALTTTLKKNGTASFYISVPDNSNVRIYDFYTIGVGTKYYNGLNLNGVNAYVTIVLKEDGKFEQANDKTIEVGGNTALKFVNESSRDVEELYMSKTSSFKDADNLIPSETVKSDKYTTIDIDLDGTKSWYFQAVTSNGKEYSGKVTFSSATVTSATLTLTRSNRLSLNGSSSGDTLLTIDNRSGDTVEEVYLATSRSKLDDADNLLDDDLEDDDTVDIDFDLDETKDWYITVIFDSNDDLKEKSLTFSYKDPAEATIRINKSSVEVRDEKRQEGDGDITVALINDTSAKVEEAYLVDSGRDFDYNDEDDILDGDKLDVDEYIVLEDIATDEKYDLVLFYDTGKNDYDYFSVDFSDADTYAAVHINSCKSESFDGDTYTDTDDDMVVGVYNDSGSTCTSLNIRDYDSSSKSLWSFSSLSDDSIEYFILDSYDYPDIEISWNGYRSYSSAKDMDDAKPFAIITINNDSGNIDVDGIDDL